MITAQKKSQIKSIGVNIFDIFKKYPSEIALIKEFIARKYKHGVYCSHCGSTNVSHRTREPKLFHCHDCVNSFSVFKSTVFKYTKVDLRKWVYAIHFMINAKKGVSACQLHRGIGGSYKTAWRMMHEIRKAMANTTDLAEFKTIVEIDETYVGGKPRRGDKGVKRGRGTTKTPVVGVYGREEKKIHAKVALPDRAGKKLTGRQLLAILEEVAAKTAEVHTDEFRSYKVLPKAGYTRMVVNHSENVYAFNGVHVNNVEGFWALLKRGIIGSFHHISDKYLQAYIDEFVFRYNNRENVFIFDELMDRVVC